jgi:hypothetical protein
MQCQGEPKDNPPPYKTRRGVHGLQVQTPVTERIQNNRLTDYLVDVASADYADRALRPGSKKKFRKGSQTEFPGKVSRTKACTVVSLEFAGRTAQGREGGRKGVEVREREDAHVQ